MADRALRGMKIGANSMETDAGVELAPRQNIEYICECGKSNVVTLSVDADIPPVWPCRCGKEALAKGAERPVDARAAKAPRSHWDMLLERRSMEELQVVLEERLELLRTGQLYKNDY